MRALEADAAHALVGGLARLGKARAAGDDAEHAAAGRAQHPCLVALGAREEDLRPVLGALDALDAADREAGLVAAGVASGGHHHADRRLVRPLDLHVCEAAVCDGLADLEQVGAQERQQRLCLRIAEAAVELDHLRAVRGQHHAGVEHAPVLAAGCREGGHGALGDLALDGAGLGVLEPAGR